MPRHAQEWSQRKVWEWGWVWWVSWAGSRVVVVAHGGSGTMGRLAAGWEGELGCRHAMAHENSACSSHPPWGLFMASRHQCHETGHIPSVITNVITHALAPYCMDTTIEWLE